MYAWRRRTRSHASVNRLTLSTNKTSAATTGTAVALHVLMFKIRQSFIGVLGIGTLLWASSPQADVRIESHRWQRICKLIIVAETHHGQRTLHNGPARSGFRKQVKGPVTVCMSRSYIPEQCGKRLTRWACKTNTRGDRTILFNVQ